MERQPIGGVGGSATTCQNTEQHANTTPDAGDLKKCNIDTGTSAQAAEDSGIYGVPTQYG